MAKNLFETIVQVIFWVFLIILISQILLKLLGNSPTDITIFYTGFVAIISCLLTMTYKVSRFMGRADEFMDNAKDSFKRIREDIDKAGKRKYM